MFLGKSSFSGGTTVKSSSIISNNAYMFHLFMYALAVSQELRELRRQYRNNKFKVFYFSKPLSNI
jgi:hypothetical protein